MFGECLNIHQFPLILNWILQVINVDLVHGRLLQPIKMPVNRVSSVMWGGRAFDILYVTTALSQLTPEQVAEYPESGSVFAIRGLEARGRVGNLFSLCEEKKDRL